MSEPRRPHIQRLDSSRDPLFQGVWISGQGNLPSLPTPPTSSAFVVAPEMPAPPREPEQDRKWQAALEISEAVLARLRVADPNFDNDLLLQVVKDLIEGKFDADDVVAVYRHRSRQGDRHG